MVEVGKDSEVASALQEQAIISKELLRAFLTAETVVKYIDERAGASKETFKVICDAHAYAGENGEKLIDLVQVFAGVTLLYLQVLHLLYLQVKPSGEVELQPGQFWAVQGSTAVN